MTVWMTVTPPAGPGGGSAVDTLLPWLIPLITALATVVVGIYTARAASAANRETSQLTGWRDLVKEGREELNRLREDREEDEERHRKERAEDRGRIEACQQQINELRVRFEEAERRERKLILWAREVVRLMRNASVPFPPPPPGVADTDPDGIAPAT